eukprot:scaffold192_cov320-Ochromonas_danica.AAC.39
MSSNNSEPVLDLVTAGIGVLGVAVAVKGVTVFSTAANISFSFSAMLRFPRPPSYDLCSTGPTRKPAKCCQANAKPHLAKSSEDEQERRESEKL